MVTGTGRIRPVLAPAAVLAGVVAAAAFIAVVDPNEAGHYPTCPFLYLTGYYCPGCGSLRMIHALTHGQLAEAFGRNALAFVLLPILGYLWVRWAVSAARERPLSSKLLRPQMIWVLTGAIVVFWVVRNLPFGHPLAP